MVGYSTQAQNKRQELEQRRQELRQEIQQITKLLNSNKKHKHSVLTKAGNINRRIRATEKLIRTNNQALNLLTDKINTNQSKIKALRKELEKLKADYARIIRQSYKSHSKQSRLMFLFSSDSFLQAYKRLQYMKQYADYREQQGEKIKKQTKELQQLNLDLAHQKDDKEKLLAKNRATKKQLQEDKGVQEALLATINKKGSSYQQQIKSKQKAIAHIDAQIQRIIREAIAAENKKKGSSSTSAFKLTPEAKALAASFRSNKGKLPWPLKHGNVVVRFGKHPSPLVKSIPIQSNGIRIATNPQEPVHTVFKGKVLKIQVIRGANKIVLVQHGDYITIYGNLDKIYVHTGQTVSTGQLLGRVGLSPTTQQPTLFFEIFKNMKYLNPLHWIVR